VIKTILVCQPYVYQSYQLCRVGKNASFGAGSSKAKEPDSVCFEILAFDVIFDRTLRPFLLDVRTVASISIPSGRSLRPVKNRRKSFDKVVNQKFFLFFTGQTTPSTQLPLIFTPLIFQSAPLTKLTPYFSISPQQNSFLYFYFPYFLNYTFNKTLPRREKAQSDLSQQDNTESVQCISTVYSICPYKYNQ